MGEIAEVVLTDKALQEWFLQPSQGHKWTWLAVVNNKCTYEERVGVDHLSVFYGGIVVTAKLSLEI